MALKKCRECNKDVSTEAETCPHCGVKKPTGPSIEDNVGAIGCGVILFIIIIIAIVGSIFSAFSSDEEKAKSSEKSQLNDARAAAMAHCPGLIESHARYGYRWTDGWSFKFDRYVWADKTKGTVTMLGDKLQFQNVFGAWTNMRYRCDWNLNTETVTNVHVSER